MLDFKDADLYKSKKSDMDYFLDRVLMTIEEKEDQARIEKEEELSDDEIVEFMQDQGGVENFLSNDEDKFRKEELDDVEESSLFLSDKELGTPYETGDKWKNMGVSSYWLFYYILRSLKRNMLSGDKLKMNKFLKSLASVSLVTLLFSSPLALFTEARFLFSLNVLAIVSLVLFIMSWAGLYVIKYNVSFNFLRVDDSDLMDEKETVNMDIEEDYAGSEFEDDVDGDATLIELANMENVDLLADSGDATDIEEDVEVMEVATRSTKSPIPYSPINVKADYEDFLEQLKQVYLANEKYRGNRSTDRTELLTSLSGYLISNDKKFGNWDVVESRGVEFNNIMYTLYLGLIAMDKRFKDTNPDNQIVVHELKENPLMYKITFETNEEMFKVSTLTSKKHLLQERLKGSDSDLDTNLLISGYQGKIILKLFKSARSLVSLGDILRYHNEDLTDGQAYETMMKPEGLPMVLGLRDSEFPVVVDLIKNTSVVVAGESGSGKSWGTFLMMSNMVFTNGPNDLNIIVLDRKKTVFWREFSRLPHVIGYHTNVPDYFDILAEVKDQMELRKSILQQMNEEKWDGMRESLRKKGQIDQLSAFPYLVVVMDEISNTLNEVVSIAGKDNQHIHDGFLSDLATLAQEGRSLGIRLVLIGQRTIDKSMPRDNLTNSSMKFFFKLIPDDVQRGFPDKNLQYPTSKGQALLKSDELSAPLFVRTLSVGGTSDDQIMHLFRMLAFEWHRRFEGDFPDLSTYYPFTFNRNTIQEVVAHDMENENYFIGSGEDTESKLADVVGSILDGSFRANNEESLVKVVIEKEDAKGNIITRNNKKKKNVDEKELPSITIRTDDDDNESYLTQDAYSTFDDSDLEMYGDVADDSDTEDGLIGYDDDGIPIYSDVGEDETLLDEEFVEVERERSKFDRPVRKSGNGQVRRVGQPLMKKSQGSVRRKPIAGNPNVRSNKSNGGIPNTVVVERKESNLPVAMYIEKYGEGTVNKFMKKEDLEKVYSKEKIEMALNTISIVERDGSYWS